MGYIDDIGIGCYSARRKSLRLGFFVEVFVASEYDDAILLALDQAHGAGRPATIMIQAGRLVLHHGLEWGIGLGKLISTNPGMLAPTLSQRRDAYDLPSTYIDLGSLVGAEDTIDLIKCDIEGSELKFLETYPDLMRRTCYFALEVHPHICSLDSCLELLRSLKFKIVKTIRNLPNAIHYLLKRVPDGMETVL